MNDQKFEEDFREFLGSMGESMVSDETISRLQECADKYDLDFESLHDWAARTIIASSLLQNVVDGFADIVKFNGVEPFFRLRDEGQNRVESILAQTVEGQQLLQTVKEKRANQDKILDADVVE